jgi:nitrile hydratase subunit alpha
VSTTAHHRNAELQARVNALLDAVERAGVVTRTEVDERAERFAQSANPANGAQVVARAWSDPGFAERLAADATTAITELGFSMGHQRNIELHAVFNTEDVHNVVVCTLCSCYPVGLLGPPPAWYKREAYRSRVVYDPRGVLREFGLEIGEDRKVSVWDATAEARYLVIPRRPAGTEHLAEAELAELVTRDCLIGTAVPEAPRS